MTTFTHTQPDGRLVFHGSRGEELVVTSSPFETDDPAVIRFLDEHPAATRTTSAAKKPAAKKRAGEGG